MAVEKGNRRCRKVVYYLTIPTFPDKILENARFLVFIIENGQEKEALLELIENEDTVKIKLFLEKIVLEKEGDNCFETLIELRKELEKMDIKLLCKGCCKNVYPSAMILNMGIGEQAYTLIYGEQAKMNSLVNIFDACSVEEYGSIEQQLEYFEGWTKSLRR